MNTGLSLLLGRFDKGSSNVTVLIERKTKWNSRFLRITFGCRKSGFRYTGYQICFYRIGFCEGFSSTDSCVIDLYSIHGAVQSGKINVFKDTVSMFFLHVQLAGFHAIPGNGNNLARFNITDKLRAYRCECTALRRQYISIVPFSKAERFQSVRVTGSDQFPGTHDHKGISSPDLLYGFMYCFFYCSRMNTFPCNMERNNLRVGSCMEDRSGLDQFPFQSFCINQISVMCKRQTSLDIRKYQRLRILCNRLSGGGITNMSDSDVTIHIMYNIFSQNFAYQSQIFMKLYVSSFSVRP